MCIRDRTEGNVIRACEHGGGVSCEHRLRGLVCARNVVLLSLIHIFDLFIEQTKDIWKDMLDKQIELGEAAAAVEQAQAEAVGEELAKKYALAPYTMFIGSGALWGETILFSMYILSLIHI